MAESEGNPARSSPASKLGIYLLISGGVMLAVMGVYQILLTSSPGEASISVADYRAKPIRDSRPAPDFTMPDLDSGEPISLTAFRGKVVVLNVWASWCLPCREEAPALQAAWEAYRNRGVQILGSNYQDDRDAALGFVREFGITYPSVFDPSGRLAVDYAYVGLPSTFVIDRAGRIRFQFTGYMTGQTLRRVLDEVLSETTA